MGLLLLFVGLILVMEGWIMAKLSDVQASLDAQTQAIVALAARIPPPAAATEADLDGVKALIDQNTATIQSLAPQV